MNKQDKELFERYIELRDQILPRIDSEINTADLDIRNYKEIGNYSSIIKRLEQLYIKKIKYLGEMWGLKHRLNAINSGESDEDFIAAVMEWGRIAFYEVMFWRDSWPY